jgi:hypothetical protein
MLRLNENSPQNMEYGKMRHEIELLKRNKLSNDTEIKSNFPETIRLIAVIK